MRTEKEMYRLILEIARQDDRIRAVYLNGSRTNANAPKDIFQDYDVVYVVTETAPYYRDEGWIDCFGPVLYDQLPDKMSELRGRSFCYENSFCWLLQLADGNRVDLHVMSAAHARQEIVKDSLCRILLDKDGCLPAIRPASEEDYWIRRPSANDFWCDCNNFWWCTNNLAKGMWRQEIPYVQEMQNSILRPHLLHVLGWRIGAENDFSVAIGKAGKYLYRYLPPSIWQRYLESYGAGTIPDLWRAIDAMCSLFDETAAATAPLLGYRYQQEYADAAKAYLAHVRALPPDAEEVF